MTRRAIARRYHVPGAVLVTYRHEPSRWYVTRPTRAGALRRTHPDPLRSYGAALVEAHRTRPWPAVRPCPRCRALGWIYPCSECHHPGP